MPEWAPVDLQSGSLNSNYCKGLRQPSFRRQWPGLRFAMRILARWALTAAFSITVAPAAGAQERPILLRPDRVFDGVTPTPHAGWAVLVRAGRIVAAGQAAQVTAQAADAQVIELPGTTLLPGLIDNHSHLL